MAAQTLVQAIQQGDLEAIDEWLSEEHDLEQAYDNHTLLWWAVDAKNIEIIDRFLSAGADIDFDAPLVHAASQGAANIVAHLLNAGADPDVRGPFGDVALRRALTTEIVKLLLDFGADPDSPNNAGHTPLMAMVTLCPEAVKILLEAGADPNLQSNNGNTPLIVAASFGRTEELKLLLESGADPNIWGEDEEICPLIAAVIQGSAETVELLLDAGVNYFEVNAEYARLADIPLISLAPDPESAVAIAAVVAPYLDRA